MKIKLISAFASAILLSGCAASKWDVDSAARMTPTGDAFTQALHKSYVERATFEKGEYDWDSVDFFTLRAVKAAEGKAVPLHSPADRKLLSAHAELSAAHAKLATQLATTAPKDAPVACATAQTALEHWMEQQEEGHQPDHIAAARDEFMKALPDCKPAPVVAAVPLAGPFVVYFDFDSSTVTPVARKTLADVASAFKAGAPAKVLVSGHTDTVGANDYNDRLATKRAGVVAAELVKLGVNATVVSASSYGKSKVAVPTRDNVKEAKNRRVEIHFAK